MEQVCSGHRILLKYENEYLYEKTSYQPYHKVNIDEDIILFAEKHRKIFRHELNDFFIHWKRNGYIINVNGKQI